MAGRRGQANWDDKYKQHKSIDTVVKKDGATMYDSDGVKRLGSFKKGDKVTFINEGKYETRALVKFEGKSVRINLDDLVKPGSAKSAQASLKPQAFNVKEGPKYTVDKLQDTLLESIDSRNDLTADQKYYLELLVLYHSQGEMISDAELREAFKPVKVNSSFVNAVKTDFSEILGPMAVIAFDLLEKVGLKYDIARDAKSWFPDLPNYPLMDYAIYSGTGTNERQIVISAKAKPGATNVVKPQDVLDLIHRQATVKRKWSSTIQYGLLKVLDDNPIATGGVAGLGYLMSKKSSLKRKYPGISDKGVADFITKKNNYDQKLWTKFIETNKQVQKAFDDKHPTTKGGAVASSLIRYACEKIIEEETKSTGVCPVTDIFTDSIKNQVYYVNYKQNSDGTPDWDLKGSVEFKKDDALQIRTKNSRNGGSDKIGFQP